MIFKIVIKDSTIFCPALVFLPFILLPTRIAGNSATIVDNIFTNNSNNTIISGNIVTDFSDHYSQFISVQRLKFDLLFLLYINDLPNISNILQFYLFADDTNIYYEDESLENLEVVINGELKKLHR